jgi:NAD(P)-dependent dehydrogenase (short-subunit alcohol dehydrogenase family)
MMMSAALDLADHAIRCNAIAPGYIDSRVLPPEHESERGQHVGEKVLAAIPSRRGGVPDDIAKAVVFLCSELGSYVNGHCLAVDGGFLVGGTP